VIFIKKAVIFFLRYEAFRYLAVSAAALVVDVLFFSMAMRWWAWPWFAAATLGFASGVFLAYGLSVRYVFSTRQWKRRPAAEFLMFAFLGMIGLITTQVTLYVCIEAFAMMPEVAKTMAAILTFFSNFLSRKLLLFR
jgi:putative flippase GtrA